MRKGSVFDIAVIIIILFSFSMMTLFGYVILKTTSETVTSMDSMPSLAKTQIQSVLGIYNLFDVGTIIIFISLSITTILLARNLPSHPVFFIFSVISLIIISLFVYIIQQVYDAFVSNVTLAPYANDFPLTATLMGNLGFVFLGLAAIILLVVYTKGDSVNVQIPV